MIAELMRRDPAWQMMKGVTATAGLLAFLLSLWHADGVIAAMAAPIYAVFLMRALPHQRSTFFEAALPVAARDLFLARLLSLLSLIWAPTIAGTAILALRGDGHLAPALPVVAAVLSLMVVVQLSVRIEQFAAPAWLVVIGLVVAGPVLVLTLAFGYRVPAATLAVLASAAVLAAAWNSLPETFQCAPREATERRQRSGGAAAPALPWWPVLRSLFNWPSMIFVPVGAMFALSGDWLLAPMYLMLAYNQAMTNSRWLRALPLSRKSLMAAMVMPMLITLGVVMEAGMLLQYPKPSRAPVQLGDPSHFRTTGTPDVSVNPAFWKLAPGGQVPTVRAPWGEGFQPAPHRLLMWTFYNPYSVGQSNTERFEFWQFGRATATIYGVALTPRELAERKGAGLRPVTLQPRMQILTIALFLCTGLFWLWAIEFTWWHRLARLTPALRYTLSYSAVLLPLAAVMGINFLAGDSFGLMSEAQVQGLLLDLSARLPENLTVVALVSLVPVMMMWMFAAWQAGGSEISQKVVEQQSLLSALGNRS